jgi:lipopolysaccharide cholinephosphotransferase
MFARYEKLCAKYNGTDNHRMSYVVHSRGKEKNMFRKEWWDETVMLPFEFIEVPAPAGYDSRLRQEFKDYMTPRNVAAGHPGAILDPDLPYDEFIRRRKKKRAAARAKKKKEESRQ